jgi:pyrroloquinoline quinone biosynthesis protein E
MSVSDIWLYSEAFNKFRGFDWMKEPCRSCPEKVKDFGGCRCQAYLLTGDMNNTDPVCSLSPLHERVFEAVASATAAAEASTAKPMIFRNVKNSKTLTA